MLEKRLKKWLVKASHAEEEKMAQARMLAEQLDLYVPTAQLLINRGCVNKNIAIDFLRKQTEQLHDPFLMKDMNKAVNKILETVADNKKIIIYGDYDVDGVTSVTILYMYLKKMGASVGYYIPSRLNEGYGMSEQSLRKLRDEGASLIITVDTGITAIEEASLIRALGMELIVTDHHECHSEMPDSFATVNPKQPDCEYPFKELAGVGVVFKLLCALEITRNPLFDIFTNIKNVSSEYIDLVAIGTVADVMPLRDENRLIVAKGLSIIESSPRLSLEMLLRAVAGDAKQQKRKITSGFIGYTIAPRVNAAGRIKNASIAVELFLSEDEKNATRLANELCEINLLRQQEENKIIEEAYEKIEKEHDFAHDPVIVLAHESWHHGIIGIVASRITEKYSRPCVLISFDEIGNNKKGDGAPLLGKGSGRSIKGMNLVDALTHCSDLLVKYGGHELAAGLTIEKSKLDAFKQRINDFARGCFDTAEPTGAVEAEYELVPSEATMEQAVELYKLEPFGVSNPIPVFVMYNMTVSAVSTVGQGKHTKLVLTRDSLVVCGMCFRKGLEELDLFAGDKVDIMFNLDINEYQNNKNLQFIIKDIRLVEGQLEENRSEHKLYCDIKNGSLDIALLSNDDVIKIIPTRSDFALVYNIIKRELRLSHDRFSIRGLMSLLSANGTPMRYVKLKYILLVFEELNILGVDKEDINNEIYKFSYIYVKNKADLDKSNILRRLKAAFIQKTGNLNG